MTITLRATKGSALSHAELDANIQALKSHLDERAWVAHTISTTTIAATSRFVTLSEASDGVVTDITSSLASDALAEVTIRNAGTTYITFIHNSTKLRLNQASRVVLQPNQSIKFDFVSGTIWQQASGPTEFQTVGTNSALRLIDYGGGDASGQGNSPIFQRLQILGTATADASNSFVASNRMVVASDSVSAPDYLSTLRILHACGGSGNAGGRVGIFSQVAVVDVVNPGTSTSNTDTVGGHFGGYSTSNQGGNGTIGVATNPDTAFKGKLTGANPQVWLASGATHYRAITGQEINIDVRSGASAFSKIGLFIVKTTIDAVQGSEDDVAIALSDQATVSAWKTGISFGVSWGKWPFNSSSTLIGAKKAVYPTDGPETTINAAYGVDLRPVTFATAAFASTGFSVDPDGDVTTKTVLTTPVAVASLPAAAAGLKGARAFVTDANATTFASVVANGGSNNVPVYCDGTNWRIG